jgi:hypothetical protein
MESSERQLPVREPNGPGDEDSSSCGTKVYVTNEEAALLRAMRGLRERGLELRGSLEQADAPEERARLEQELADLRQQRRELEGRREGAFVRKMVMLGHLPEQALSELDEL